MHGAGSLIPSLPLYTETYKTFLALEPLLKKITQEKLTGMKCKHPEKLTYTVPTVALTSCLAQMLVHYDRQSSVVDELMSLPPFLIHIGPCERSRNMSENPYLLTNTLLMVTKHS